MRRSVQVCSLASALLMLAAAANGQVIVSGAGGVFVPFDGSAGPSGLVQVVTPSGNWRFGGEFEYRNYKTSLFDVDDVGVDSFSFRAIVQYTFRSEGVVPYVGGGIGVNVNVIDGNKIERESATIVDVSDVGAGLGVLVLGGVEVPLGATISLFAEGRVSADFQLTDQTSGGGSGDIGVENLGGVTGLGGVRVRF